MGHAAGYRAVRSVQQGGGAVGGYWRLRGGEQALWPGVAGRGYARGDLLGGSKAGGVVHTAADVAGETA